MTRVLAIDHGSARVGIAISDPTATIARAYLILNNSDQLIGEILTICEKEKVNQIILGLPISLSGQETSQTQSVRDFFEKLSRSTSLPIELEDERLSSRMADSNLRAKSQKSANDAEAAAVILRSYLDRLQKTTISR